VYNSLPSKEKYLVTAFDWGIELEFIPRKKNTCRVVPRDASSQLLYKADEQSFSSSIEGTRYLLCRLNCPIWLIIAFFVFSRGRGWYDLGESQGEFERVIGG
jgi:hypothetical protein